jgi:glycosyltransferase involved in cell wall biosynthesis
MGIIHQMLVSNELGGAGLMALRLANFLKGHSQESHVWIPGEGPAQRKAYELGLRCHLYNPASIFTRSRIAQITANCEIGRLLYHRGPGILHTYSPFYYRVFLLGLKISCLKTVVHIQLEEEEAGLRWAFKKPPNLIITCAKFLVEDIRRALPLRYQAHQRIVSVANAVDVNQFFSGDKSAAKLRVGASLDTPLLLMLANLAPHKGQETAIRATAVLREADVNVVLWLAGVEREGERRYTAQLRCLASELGVNDRVRFLGHRDDAPDLLRAADIFLLPSTREGLPLSILEAQATKVPVLAAPSSGIPEVVIDGETGFLIAADDVKGYASLIQSLLFSPDLSQHIAEQAYAKILSDHTFQAYGGKILQLYKSLLNQDNTIATAY